MPHSRESKEKETHTKEIESDNADHVSQRGNQGGVGASPPDEGGGLSAGSNHNRLFAFIREAHLEEAQEFRLKGYNSQVPEVDAGLLTQLRDGLTAAKSRQYVQASVGGGLGSRWLLEQIGQIERLTDKLSDRVIKNWIEHELPRKKDEEAAEAKLGSRRTAQSLARRLESTLQALINIVHTLSAMDDYSTPEKRHDMLVAELTGAFSASDKNTVIEALGRMTAETSGHADWASIMQARASAWEVGKLATVEAMIATSRHEAEKANKKARELRGDPQTFFSHVAAYLQHLSSDLANSSINASLNPASPVIPHDEAIPALSRSNSLLHRIRTDYDKKKLQAQTAVAGIKVHAHRFVRFAQHGHPTRTPTKAPDQVVADSIIRSILWQWQQSAIKIQYASAALLSKVDELKKIEGVLTSYTEADERENKQERRSPSGEEALDAEVREWVSATLKQVNPENQRAAKVATLERLLGGDIASARNLVERLGKTEESIQNLLRQQRVAVLKMAVERLPAATSSLKAVDRLLPDMAGDLTASIAALDNALQAAEYPARDFSEAKIQAGYAQLLATKVKESLSAASARLTERPLDEHSLGVRLAKHWANIAKEQNMGTNSPHAWQVLASLKQQGLLAGTLSTGDPAGYLFATRLASELENVGHDELRLPMSPEQYAALEKGLVEYIVKWGQKQISQGVTRIVIELSFEQALDTVSFNVSRLFRLPYKVLKASIKIPYNVNKVNKYIMPGQDKPYKAIYGLLGKKLKQLGFNLLTAPVPGVIKLAAGTGVTAGAALHNLHVENREKTFSAVYQHVVEGKKSEKIKMGSVGEMIFDSVLDTAAKAALKGGREIGQSGRNKDDFEINKGILSQAQQRQVAANNDDTAWGNAAENERKIELVNHQSPLWHQTDVRPFSEQIDPASNQPRVRHKRTVGTMTTNASLQPEISPDMHYKDFSDDKKKSTYLYGIKFVLYQIENDRKLSDKIRRNAYLARIGHSNVVPADIIGYRLNNTFLLPDSPGSKSGVLVRLDSDKPYYYVSRGSDLLRNIKWALPYDSNKWGVRGLKDSNGRIRNYNLPGAATMLGSIIAEYSDFEELFNYNEPTPTDIASLSSILANSIEEDYKKKSTHPKNINLIARAIAGNQIPDPGVAATQMKYKLEFSWDNLSPAEYLRSFSQPFSTLSGQGQLIASSINGETIQETELHVYQAQYIGSWIDATVGAINSFTPAGVIFNTAQSVAAIAADLTEGKDPDPLVITALIVGCIPGGRIAAKVGKFTHIGSQAVKHGLMLGNKAIDLSIVGRSIKTAVETDDPLAIYQAFLDSGMSAKNSYDIAKSLSSKLKISKTLEDNVQLNKSLKNVGKVDKTSKESESTSPQRLKPVKSLENSQEVIYSGPSDNTRVSFDQTTEHHIMLNKATRFILNINLAGTKIQFYDKSSSKFKSSDEFKIDKGIPVGTKKSSLNDMTLKTGELMNQLQQFKGTDKQAVSDNLKNIKSMIDDIIKNTSNSDGNSNFESYFLVGRNKGANDIKNHYGLAEFKFSYENNSLTINNLIAHPYVIINKYPAFRDYLIGKEIISKSDFEQYNIKNVARYLGANSAVNEIKYYETLPSVKVKTLSFNGANPITQKLGYKLEGLSRFFSRKRFSSEPDYTVTQDELLTRQTNTDLFNDILDYLKANVREEFRPVKPIEEIPSEKTDAEIAKIMTNGDAEIISRDISESRNSLDSDTSSFSHEVIASVDRSYEKVNSVKSLFERADSIPEVKNKLRELIDEAAGLNDEVIIDIDKADVSRISDMAYDRFKDNVNNLNDYLYTQKTGGYKSFVLFKYRQFNSSKPDAFALPYDRKKRILLAILPGDQRHGGLVDTVTHEASHNASYTLDHTYIGNVRSETGSFPSSFEPSARDVRHFHENERVLKLSAKYALDLPENANLTKDQETMANILLQNSRLTKADTLLNAAEYNAYMIDVLSRAKIKDSHLVFKENTSRIKRSVSGGNHEHDDIIMLASLNVTLPVRNGDVEGGNTVIPSVLIKALTKFINKDGTNEKVGSTYAPYLSAFSSMPKIQDITLQQVKDLKNAHIATGGDIPTKAKYYYALLGYLSGPKGIKLPIDANILYDSIQQDLNEANTSYDLEKSDMDNVDIKINMLYNQINESRGRKSLTERASDINKYMRLREAFSDKQRRMNDWEVKKNQATLRLGLWNDIFG